MSAEDHTPRGRGRPKPAPADPAQRPADPGWAWAAYQPDARRPWDLRRAGHLYRRAAFGADWDQLQQALAAGPRRSIDRLLRPEGDPAAFNRTYDGYDAAAAGSASGLRAWWLRRMIHTPHPLLEKMTLFWHNHFAVSNVRVKSGPLMQRHVGMLRTHALGQFQEMLGAVLRDPAVFLCLGASANRKAQPNDHYARTLLEVFTLGPGTASEEDVRGAARAVTGWFVLRGRLRYIAREHDSGAKAILGETGDFGDKDLVRILLRQPALPRLLVRRLYRWLISETDEPSDALIAPLAESLAKDYDVARLVERMLRSNLFFSAAAYRQRIKCPVEFAVGIVRGLEGSVSTARLGEDLAALGQDLYHPPTIQGWEGGRHWINRATLLGRSNLASALLAGSEAYQRKLDPMTVAQKHGHSTVESAGGFLLDLFLQGDLEADVRQALLTSAQGRSAPAGGEGSQRLAQFAHAVLTLPEFQLA